GTKFVVYANHIEYTDPIYVRLLFRKHALAFVAKEPLFKTFLIKNLLNGIGCISIGKDADRSAMKSILESIKRVKDGQPFGIFPEGKRTYSNDLTEFKAGAFKLAQKANADIVPVCLYNMHGILRKGRIRTQKVYVHIFEAIPHEDFASLDTFVIADRVKSLISSKLEEFKERIPQD
ncbi:MAG: lysophospholipid acyltransferase family protein, partial [Candidatus Izemoplasmatales bacterium]|nr:lysophospholipid acyltransferase family protein [Candidatus Izemoplasmatales bacterium]